MTHSTNEDLISIKNRILHQYYHQKKPIEEIAKIEGRSVRTIYRWLQKAQNQDINGQSKQPRICHYKSIFPDEVWTRIVELKLENTKRTAQIIHNHLKADNYPKIPSMTSIRRHLSKSGLGRISSEYRRGYIAFEREFPNELWQIDIAGVQTVGHLGQLYLFALLDDCSRFIPAAFYVTDQKAFRVIQLLQDSITKYGRPLQILADNGTQFKNILGNLGSKYERLLKLIDVKPVFARVRHPQTKGKLERFFGTVKTMFLSEARFQVKSDPSYTLGQFNQDFEKWLKFYNTQHKHRGLPNRCSPSKIYFGKENRIFRPIKVQIDWDRWIAQTHRRKVMKSNTISYNGQHFSIPPGFAGLEVNIWVNPDTIAIFRGEQCIVEHKISPALLSKRKSQSRKISHNGTIGYEGKHYYISYKMSGQQVLVRESADGKDLLIYHQNQLLTRIER
jgi:transposase InsO family protein